MGAAATDATTSPPETSHRDDHKDAAFKHLLNKRATDRPPVAEGAGEPTGATAAVEEGDRVGTGSGFGGGAGHDGNDTKRKVVGLEDKETTLTAAANGDGDGEGDGEGAGNVDSDALFAWVASDAGEAGPHTTVADTSAGWAAAARDVRFRLADRWLSCEQVTNTGGERAARVT